MGSGSGDERESALQSGWTVEAAPTPAEVVPPEPVSEPEQPAEGAGGAATTGQQMSNMTVVLLGVSGGLFLLFAWVWMSWAQHYAGVNAAAAAGSGSVGGALQQIIFWIAPLAPVLWFISALALVRHHPRKLIVALVLGLILTFPLPMVFLSGAAL